VKPPSLRARMAATALLVSTLTAALLIVGVALLLQQANDATAQSRLDARVSAAAATVVEGPNGVRVLEQPSRLLDQDVWIFDGSGHLIDGNLPRGVAARTVTTLGNSSETRTTTVDDVAFLARPVVRNGVRVATVVAAESHEPYERAERSSIWLTIGLGVATVAIATGAAWMAATRSLRQVQAMADLADDWGEHDVGRRFDPGPGGDEIAHLGRTLDQLLDRIVDSLSAERRLTDEIAHELRTPLAVVLAEADLARHETPPDQREGLDNIHAAAVRMRDSIDTLLSVARAHASGERATVAELMAALELPSTAYDGVVLSAPVSPLVAALRPLLENAERHGSGEPRVEVTRDGRTVVIAVLDDGSGVPPDDLERVFDPGHTSDVDGSGLGLPLARRMVRAVGGDVIARPGPGGRFEVRVSGR
jgi:two-component system OmpR family sensor kinase